MSKQQKIILSCLKKLLQDAKSPTLRKDIEHRIADFEKSCKPKPKSPSPAWLDKF